MPRRMRVEARTWGPFVLVGAAAAWLASTITATGEWDTDTWPRIQALTHGNVIEFFRVESMMGPFASVVQAPFAAISGGGELVAYRWSAFACLLAAGLLGLYLAHLARRRGVPTLGQALIAGLCLVNPLTIEALDKGHPEELLTAALAVAAIATASEGHRYRAALLLGLAVASKQWAVIAILPVLMALPSSRIRVALIAGAIVAVLTLPALIAAPDSFSEVHGAAASTGRVVTPWSVWYPAAEVTSEHHRIGSTSFTAEVHEAPPLVGSLSHPLIVFLAFGLPVALALRRGEFRISGPEAMALLALLALLRCALDPVDNFYYHVPLLLALLGWDGLDAERLPLRGLAGTAIALLFWQWSHNLSDVQLFNFAYVTVAVAAGVIITFALFARKVPLTHVRPVTANCDSGLPRIRRAVSPE
jgi:Glycosyltransferase family 87